MNGPGPTRIAARRVLTVADRDAGCRLDAFLAARLGVARTEARRLLERGAVSIEQRPLGLRHKGTRVSTAMRLEVAAFVPPSERRPTARPELPLRVLAEGPGWLALDKPPGWPVHPLATEQQGTLLNALLARHPEVYGVGEGGLRSGVVHRLDLDTSGVVLFARDEPTWRWLRQAFRAQLVEKVYRAIVLGHLEGAGSESFELAVAQHRPARVRVVAPTGSAVRAGRRVQMRWRALEPLRGATLVEVRPRSGFLHQIRAVFAHLGYPILGDRSYGLPTRHDPSGWPRHMLHASRLAVGPVAVESPDPTDFVAALQRLRR